MRALRLDVREVRTSLDDQARVVDACRKRMYTYTDIYAYKTNTSPGTVHVYDACVLEADLYLHIYTHTWVEHLTDE